MFVPMQIFAQTSFFVVDKNIDVILILEGKFYVPNQRIFEYNQIIQQFFIDT